MRGIRLKNIRSIEDSGQIKIKPITLFVGQNSSGKSSVLRTLPLILQSSNTRTNTPILWYGDYVDFGSLAEIRSRFNSKHPVEIEIDVGKISYRRQYPLDYSSASHENEFSLGLKLSDVDGKTQLASFYLLSNSDRLEFELNARGQVTKVDCNGNDYSDIFPSDNYRISASTLVPQLSSPRSQYFLSGNPYRQAVRLNDPAVQKIKAIISEFIHKRTTDDKLDIISHKIPYRSKRDFVRHLSKLSTGLVTWSNLIEFLGTEKGKQKAEELRILALLASVPEILFELQRSINKSANGISYVGPTRATGERYYRIQELAVDRIDPQGKNLSMFLHSLSSSLLERFSDWLTESIGYAIRIERSTGHVQIELSEQGTGQYFNLADMGYGFSQLLPILAQIWSRTLRRPMAGPISRNLIVAMEQPELHLHPAYQARFADVVSKSVQSLLTDHGRSQNMSFVIETHSEALINRLGQLIYEGKLSHESVAIYIFDKPPNREKTKITESSFNTDGTLVNWPVGFFSSEFR